MDFELWCTAVSAINGCGLCVDSHEQVLRIKGMPEESIVAAVRLASVIHGLATVFDTEAVAQARPCPSDLGAAAEGGHDFASGCDYD